MPATMEKICRTCKAAFAFPMVEATFACPYCNTLNGRPKAEGADYEPLQRATIQRLNCDFRNAEDSYQHALRRQPEEHEALWGLALCRYGIEYVRDPRTGKLMPTVHGVCKKPIQRDKDFQNACRCAPEDVRVQYRAEAEYIDNTMAGIRQLAATKPDFDVFICHKSTIPGTKEDPTKDCMRGSAIAHMLDKLGYRVFFAPEVMQGVAVGSDYEAAIFHALDTAKVMLLICSDEDYINSAWVRSEWLRFLDMVDTREDKVLVPLFYGDFLPAQMPEELRPYNLEGVKMESLSAKDDLLHVVRTFCGSPENTEPAPLSESKPVPPVSAKPAPVPPAPESKPAPAPAAPAIPTPTPAKPVSPRDYDVYISYKASLPEKPGELTEDAARARMLAYALKGMDYNVFDARENLPKLAPGANYAAEIYHALDTAKVMLLICSKEEYLTGEWFREEWSRFLRQAGPGSGRTLIPLLYDGFTLSRLPERLRSHALQPVNMETLTAQDELQRLLEEALRRQPEMPASDFRLKRIAKGWAISEYTGHAEEVVIPAMVDGGYVVQIGEYAFLNQPQLKRVVLPEKLAGLSGSSFAGCMALEEIVVDPDSKHLAERDGVICDLEQNMLLCCLPKLAEGEFVVPGYVRKIGQSAFMGYQRLTGVVLPDGLENIGSRAFMSTGLKKVRIPDRVKFIDSHAFANNAELESVSLPEHTEMSSLGVFDHCPALGEQNIVRRKKNGSSAAFQVAPGPGGVTIAKYTGPGGDVIIPEQIGGKKVVAIGSSAFSDCTTLSSVRLPDSVTSIGNYAFARCTGLTCAEIPKGVKSIGKHAFWRCDRLPAGQKIMLKLRGAM